MEADLDRSVYLNFNPELNNMSEVVMTLLVAMVTIRMDHPAPAVMSVGSVLQHQTGVVPDGCRCVDALRTCCYLVS